MVLKQQLGEGRRSPFQLSQLSSPRGSLFRTIVERVKPDKSAVRVTPEAIILAAVVYGVLFFSMGNIWLPGNAAFCTLLIWATGVVLAEVAHWLRIPRVVGMLAAGILLANVSPSPVAAFPKKWGTQMRAAALATIFLRCGLELEFKTMRLYKWPALRLAFVPGLIEAVYDAGIATAVFGMPYTLSLSLGFILKAVGPGLVVPAMFHLQQQGWGAVKGIPSTVVIAASFDDIIAITGFSIFINIAVSGSENAAWQIASGPLQVIFGLVGGYIGGVALGCTRLFDNKYKRLIGIFGTAQLLMFFLEHFDMLSGGALGSLAVGLVTSYHWDHGLPRCASTGADTTYSYLIERVMAKLWNWVMEPLLFSTMGTGLHFSTLGGSTVALSVLIVATGLCVRIIATFTVMTGLRYTWRERLFFATAWSPKATVQASLSAVPLTMIQKYKVDDPDYAQWEQWGEEILTTGLFAIIICATLGTLMVYWLAPLLLTKEEQIMSPGTLTKANSRALTGLEEVSRPSCGTASRRSFSAEHIGTGLDELQRLPDHELKRVCALSVVDEYLGAIDLLVELVRSDQVEQAKDDGVLDTVERLGKVIHQSVDQRQQTVRQLLHNSALRSAQSISLGHDDMLDHLVRLSLDVQGAVEAGQAVPPQTAKELAAVAADAQAALSTSGGGGGSASPLHGGSGGGSLVNGNGGNSPRSGGGIPSRLGNVSVAAWSSDSKGSRSADSGSDLPPQQQQQQPDEEIQHSGHGERPQVVKQQQ